MKRGAFSLRRSFGAGHGAERENARREQAAAEFRQRKCTYAGHIRG